MLNSLASMWKRPSIRDRRFQRFAAELPAELFFTDRDFALSGMLIEISRGGALFREATPYILDRKRASVVLRACGLEIPGVIANVRASGYGIRFSTPLIDNTVAEIIAAAQSQEAN